MYIETWRWRMVILALAVLLLWAGGYGALHPDSMLLNLCYSQTSVFLQRLNQVLSTGAFVLVAASGGLLVWYVWYSIKRGMAIREDRPPRDFPKIVKTVVGYVLLFLALAAGVMLTPWVLKGTTLDPKGRPDTVQSP